MYKIEPCSGRARVKLLNAGKPDIYGVKRLDELDVRTKYPFELLCVGESFYVPLTAVKMAALRSYCSAAHPFKRFCVLVHEARGQYEVARLL